MLPAKNEQKLDTRPRMACAGLTKQLGGHQDSGVVSTFMT